jgi:hypothetical protein
MDKVIFKRDGQADLELDTFTPEIDKHRVSIVIGSNTAYPNYASVCIPEKVYTDWVKANYNDKAVSYCLGILVSQHSLYPKNCYFPLVRTGRQFAVVPNIYGDFQVYNAKPNNLQEVR